MRHSFGSFLLAGSTFLALSQVAHLARADGLAPKVCVVVAGDPDRAVRDAARTLAEGLALRADVRTIADQDTAGLLRGEPVATVSPIVDSRRGLHDTDQDLAALSTLGTPFGCTHWFEMSAGLTGLRVRIFDVVHQQVVPQQELAAFDTGTSAGVIEGLVQKLHPQALPAPPTGTVGGHGGSTVPPGATIPVDPTKTANNTSRVSTIVGWVVGGTAVAALVLTFIVVSLTSAPQAPTIAIVHAGTP